MGEPFGSRVISDNYSLFILKIDFLNCPFNNILTLVNICV
jgi:hypothetical protein